MKKRTKLSLVLSSLAAIAIAGATMAGGTYALFTSESKVNIAVSSGKVDVTATVSDLKTYSGVDLIGDPLTDSIAQTDVVGIFTNGGTAKIEGDTLKLAKMTPGDKVTFKIDIKNNSNVAAKYRTVVSGDESELFDALEYDLGGASGETYSAWSSVEDKTLECSVVLPSDASNDLQDLECSIKFAVEAIQGNAQTEIHYASLDEAFKLNGRLKFDSTEDTPLTLDGKGMIYIDNWVDAWLNSDTIIKGITFVHGATLNIKKDDATVTIDNCTFNPCSQNLLTYTTSNSTANSGDGMCLNLEKTTSKNVKYVIKNSKFIGENDDSLPIYGNSYNADGSVKDAFKKRAHGIAFDAIAGLDTNSSSIATAMIKNCEISGVRGNAIQLYGGTGEFNFKKVNINSWGINSGSYDKNGTTKDGNAAAIRGDYSANGSRKINLSKVYFGLAEGSHGATGKEVKLTHIEVGSYLGNTDGTRAAGTYSYSDK